MHRISCILLLCITIPHYVLSQVLPKDGSVLNYRLIGFSFPPSEGVADYKIEIAAGTYYSADSFEKKIIVEQAGTENKIIAEVPSFGAQYTWRVVYRGKDNSTTKSNLFHFITSFSQYADTNNTRLRIIHAAVQYKDAYVFLDGSGTLYDMNGRPVWLFPRIGVGVPKPTDIKLSPKGTITFMLNGDAYEINYNGEILWKGPNNGVVSGGLNEGYHHEFTRLHNGHYMVLGIELSNVIRDVSRLKDRNLFMVSNEKLAHDGNDSLYEKQPFGTIIEYDEKGNVVWSWKESEYFMKSDLFYRKTEGTEPNCNIHENSFFFDEKNGTVYVSFKTISRILKIKYPQGEILNTYGETYKPGGVENKNDLFYGQHSIKCSANGNLYLYNNNMHDATCLPKITELQEPGPGKGLLKKVWEFDCAMKDIPVTIQNGLSYVTGGNVMEMPGAAMFVSMAVPHSELFIVGPDKQILWSALPEQLDHTQNKWSEIPEYRSSIINSKQDMYHLIRGEEIGK